MKMIEIFTLFDSVSAMETRGFLSQIVNNFTLLLTPLLVYSGEFNYNLHVRVWQKLVILCGSGAPFFPSG